MPDFISISAVSTEDYTYCNTPLDLQKPLFSGWEGRGFSRRYLFHYTCPVCGNTTKVKATAFRGKTPVTSPGAIRCPYLKRAV